MPSSITWSYFDSAPRKVLVEHQYEALGEDESMQSEYDYEDVVVESEAYSEWPNLAGRRENYTTALPHTPASPHAHREKSQGTTIKQTRFTCSILRVLYEEVYGFLKSLVILPSTYSIQAKFSFTTK